MSATVYKRCACGAEYTLDEWCALRLVGRDHSGQLELRDCVCGSTLALEYILALQPDDREPGPAPARVQDLTQRIEELQKEIAGIHDDAAEGLDRSTVRELRNQLRRIARRAALWC